MQNQTRNRFGHSSCYRFGREQVYYMGSPCLNGLCLLCFLFIFGVLLPYRLKHLLSSVFLVGKYSIARTQEPSFIKNLSPGVLYLDHK